MSNVVVHPNHIDLPAEGDLYDLIILNIMPLKACGPTITDQTSWRHQVEHAVKNAAKRLAYGGFLAVNIPEMPNCLLDVFGHGLLDFNDEKQIYPLKCKSWVREYYPDFGDVLPDEFDSEDIKKFKIDKIKVFRGKSQWQENSFILFEHRKEKRPTNFSPLWNYGGPQVIPDEYLKTQENSPETPFFASTPAELIMSLIDYCDPMWILDLNCNNPKWVQQLDKKVKEADGKWGIGIYGLKGIQAIPINRPDDYRYYDNIKDVFYRVKSLEEQNPECYDRKNIKLHVITGHDIGDQL